MQAPSDFKQFAAAVFAKAARPPDEAKSQAPSPAVRASVQNGLQPEILDRDAQAAIAKHCCDQLACACTCACT
jgi:hypothetical protein